MGVQLSMGVTYLGDVSFHSATPPSRSARICDAQSNFSTAAVITIPQPRGPWHRHLIQVLAMWYLNGHMSRRLIPHPQPPLLEETTVNDSRHTPEAEPSVVRLLRLSESTPRSVTATRRAGTRQPQSVRHVRDSIWQERLSLLGVAWLSSEHVSSDQRRNRRSVAGLDTVWTCLKNL